MAEKRTRFNASTYSLTQEEVLQLRNVADIQQSICYLLLMAIIDHMETRGFSYPISLKLEKEASHGVVSSADMDALIYLAGIPLEVIYGEVAQPRYQIVHPAIS
ncbi:MAG: hypothetical protein A2804_02420 [Candidatus Pacebacteria bacterium RIFCSPHIGHO2_01_FULL_46_10]|nr:MAG: hypothetical protein A2804_02420 [Candidatus Pacebacteria bacterium RIFCSPHIGHO2_01_FULL_46_10]